MRSLYLSVVLLSHFLPSSVSGYETHDWEPSLYNNASPALQSADARVVDNQRKNSPTFLTQEHDSRRNVAIENIPDEGLAYAINADHKHPHFERVRRSDHHHGEKKMTELHSTGSHSSNHSDSHHAAGIHVASWRWDEIGIYFTFTVFIIIAGLAKVAFHHAHFLSSRVPESCLLIVLGIIVGGILYAAGVGLCEGVRGPTRIPGCTEDENKFVFPTFTPRLFFLILLPPIILESAYSLYDRAFANNVGTVLFYAIIGTLFNTFLIGLTLLGLVKIGGIGSVTVTNNHADITDIASNHTDSEYTYTATDCLVFSALISAVDPVAVLAIFQEVGVNKNLYFLVFGESLLNDAVSVVMYTTMVAFATMPDIDADQYALGFAAFLTVSLGGFSIGLVYGILTALITKTTSEVRVVEPLAVLGVAYLSYITAELFHFSGIISIIGCGLVQAHYAFANISHKSYTTVKYFTKMISSTSDAIIFLFLGMVLVNDVHEWHTGFVLWTLALCFAVRFLGVFSLTAVANRFRLKTINIQEQFIMAYGGLRGAVSFSLVEMLEPSVVKPRQIFVTTTLAVILFTVFVQGSTIKLFVDLLDIQKAGRTRKNMASEINETLMDHLTAGIEEICGHHGNNYLREWFEYVDEKYLRCWLVREQDYSNSFTRLFEKIAITEHYANMYTGLTPVPSNSRIEPVKDDSVSQETTPLIGSDSPIMILPPDKRNENEVNETKPTSRVQLKRQASAPPLDLRTASRESESLDLAEVEVRRRALTDVRPGQRHSTASSVSLQNETDSKKTVKTFRKALRSSAGYKTLYLKHNKNLIGDDDAAPLEVQIRNKLSTTTDPQVFQVVSRILRSPVQSPTAQRRGSLQCHSLNTSFESQTLSPSTAGPKKKPPLLHRHSASVIQVPVGVLPKVRRLSDSRKERPPMLKQTKTAQVPVVRVSVENEKASQPTQSPVSYLVPPRREIRLPPAFRNVPLGMISERSATDLEKLEDMENDDTCPSKTGTQETGV